MGKCAIGRLLNEGSSDGSEHISSLYINAKMHSLCILNQYIAIKQNFQGIFVCLDKPFTQVRDKNFSEFRTR